MQIQALRAKTLNSISSIALRPRKLGCSVLCIVLLSLQLLGCGAGIHPSLAAASRCCDQVSCQDRDYTGDSCSHSFCCCCDSYSAGHQSHSRDPTSAAAVTKQPADPSVPPLLLFKTGWQFPQLCSGSFQGCVLCGSHSPASCWDLTVLIVLFFLRVQVTSHSHGSPLLSIGLSTALPPMWVPKQLSILLCLKWTVPGYLLTADTILCHHHHHHHCHVVSALPVFFFTLPAQPSLLKVNQRSLLLGLML